jgi:hypothetical protein
LHGTVEIPKSIHHQFDDSRRIAKARNAVDTVYSVI